MQNKDFISNTLSSSLSSGATTLDLNDSAGFPNPSNGGPYFVGIWQSTDYASPELAKASNAYETVLVTAISSNTLDIQRGFGGTSDIDHNAGGKTYTVSFLALAENIDSGFAINVRSFGAVADGTTDDSAAFSSAMSVAMDADLPIFCPPGQYKISTAGTLCTTDGPVYIFGIDRERTTIIGTGSNDFIKLDSADSIQITDIGFKDIAQIIDLSALATGEKSSRCVIKNCLFNNVDQLIGDNATKPSNAGITFGEISNCHISGTGTSAVIDIIQEIQEFHFINNIIESQQSTLNYILNFGRDNSSISEESHWTNIHVTGNIIRSCTVAGSIGQGISCYGKRCNISSNTFDGISGASTINSAILAYMRDSSISNNRINLSGSDDIAIWVAGERRGQTGGVNSYQTTISGNQIFLSGGIALDSNGDEIVFSGNSISGCGIGVQLNEPLSRDHIISNNMFLPHTADDPKGISITTSCSNVVISGNVFSAYGSNTFTDCMSFVFSSSAVEAESWSITGNIMKGFTANGILIDTGTAASDINQLSIMNNIINSTESGSIGIKYQGTAPITDHDTWGNSILTEGDNFSFTTRPQIGTLMQYLDPLSHATGYWTARNAALAVMHRADFEDVQLYLKRDGDRTDQGWEGQA